MSRSRSGMLAKAGRDAGALECGAHWPLGEKAARALARSGESPSALHNNCSGKHAGFVCLACAEGTDPKGYVSPDHPVQRAVTEALADVTGAKLGAENRAIDGCSIPAYAIPLRALAFGFARFGTGQGSAQSARGRRRACARRLRRILRWWRGTGRFDTEVMTLLGARAFTKTGAEGAFCAALPELGLGLAVKADDGAGRAAQVMIAALLRRFGGFGEPLDRFVAPEFVNWNGIAVGALRPAWPLA